MSNNNQRILPTAIQVVDESAKVLEPIVPELGSDFEIKRKGKIDRRVVSNITIDDAVCLPHIHYRATVDKVKYFQVLEESILALSRGVDGFGSKQIVEVATGIGGSSRKVVQKKSWTQRHVTQRGQGEYEEVEVP